MSIQVYKRGRAGVNGRVLASTRDDNGIFFFNKWFYLIKVFNLNDF